MIMKMQKIKGRRALLGAGALVFLAGVWQWRSSAPDAASASTEGYQPTRHANVMVRDRPTHDGNSRVKNGAGWVYGKPTGTTGGTARSAAPVAVQRGTTAAGGYYVTLPPNLYPRATAQVGRDGKLIINCAGATGAHGHNHKHDQKCGYAPTPTARRSVSTRAGSAR